MDTLTQKKFLTKRIFTIEEKGVKISEKKLGSFKEYLTKFDDISNSEVLSMDSKRGWLIALVFSYIFTIFLFFTWALTEGIDASSIWVWLVASVVCTYLYISSRKNTRIIQGINVPGLVFISDEPDKKSVDDFVKKVYSSRKEFYLKKFINESFTPDERSNNLNWLYNGEIISLEEFKKQKEILSESEIKGF